MPKASKFTKEQKLEIALVLITAKLSRGEVCRKHGISATYAYKLKDRALEFLHQGIDPGDPAARGCEQELGLSRSKIWHRPYRPKRVEKMRPSRMN